MQKTYFEYSEKELDYLCKKDKKLGEFIKQTGMLKRELNPDLPFALIESVVSQQISTKAATTVISRLKALCNTDIQILNSLNIEQIQACGMSLRKASYIKDIAVAATLKTIDFEALPQKTDEDIIKELTKLKGIGIWTVQMLLIFSLSRKNIISYEDLAIRRGIMHIYNHKELPKSRFLRYAKRYSPYASIASLYLWEAYDAATQKYTI